MLLCIYIFTEHKPLNTIIYTYINSDLYYKTIKQKSTYINKKQK